MCPALRARREDIPVLTEHFLRRSALELDTETKLMLPQTQTFLNRLDWPGNVRQLENFCRRITVMARARRFTSTTCHRNYGASTHPIKPQKTGESTYATGSRTNLLKGETGLLSNALPEFERILIEEALQQTSGRRVEAAKLLGLGRNTLTRKIKGLGLEV